MPAPLLGPTPRPTLTDNKNGEVIIIVGVAKFN